MNSFSYYIDKFLNYLDIEKNYSQHTIANYKKDLAEFDEFLGSNDCRDIKVVDYFLLRKFLGVLAKKELDKRTISRKISTLKSFFKFIL